MNVTKFALAFFAILPIMVYRALIRPLLPKSCKFFPTCSAYTIIAITRFGVVRGWGYGVWRIMRCNPFNKKGGGYDPVPYKYSGGAKWVI